MNTTPPSLSGQSPPVYPLGTCYLCKCTSAGKQVVVISQPCRHYFHFECLAPEVNQTLTCPLGCKQVTGLQFLPPLQEDWQERLCTAAANGDMQGLMQILHRGVDVNAGKSGSETPLRKAIYNMRLELTRGKCFEVASELLRLGADSNDAICKLAWNYQREDSRLMFIRCLELATHNGHGEAAYQLGICYLHGRCNLGKNRITASLWLGKAATLQHGAGMVVLAAMHHMGFCNIAPNNKKASQLITQAAANDYGPAIFALGYYHLTGILPGIKKSMPQAMVLLEKGLKKDISWCLHYYCELLDGDGRPSSKPEALHWIQLFADRGDHIGQFKMGDACYVGSYGVSRDYAQARDWYIKSAKQGNVSAMVSLAIMCRRGHGGPFDQTLAVKLLSCVIKNSLSMTHFIRVSLLKDPGAVNSLQLAKAHLAELYLWLSEDVPIITCEKDALKLLKEAMTMDCTYALILMGKIHFQGLYSHLRSPARAFALFTRAVKEGDCEGYYHQALVRLDPSWSGYDRDEGLSLLQKACTLGVENAQLFCEQFLSPVQFGGSAPNNPVLKSQFEMTPGKIRVPTQPPVLTQNRASHVLLALFHELSQPPLESSHPRPEQTAAPSSETALQDPEPPTHESSQPPLESSHPRPEQTAAPSSETALQDPEPPTKKAMMMVQDVVA